MTERITFADWVDVEAPEHLRATIKACLVTRGPRKGLLKKSPPSQTDGCGANYGAYNALMMSLAPSRVSIGGMVLASTTAKETFKAVCDLLETEGNATAHYHVLNALAQRPYEFSTYAHRFDTDRIAAAAARRIRRIQQERE